MNWKSIRLWPVVLAIGLVPLLASVNVFTTDLGKYNWFLNGNTFIDLFLKCKGQVLIFLIFLMLLFAFVTIGNKRSLLPEWERLRSIEMIIMAAYFLLAFLSACFSANPKTAFFGGYEQWEGLNVIFAYCILLAYTYLMVDSEETLKVIVCSVILGSLVVGLIGAGQFFHLDLFRSEFGQGLMNMFASQKYNFSFNFEEGRVYTTLYNPNYVGSYEALVLPVLVAVVAMSWKKMSPAWWGMALLSFLLNLITLFGSDSLTGCIGVIVAAVFVVIYRFPVFAKKLGAAKMGIAAGVCVIIVAVICVGFRENIKAAYVKLTDPQQIYAATESNTLTKKLLSTEKGLEITTVNDDVFYLNLTGDANQPFSLVDNKGTALSLLRNEKTGGYYTTDTRISKCAFYKIEKTVNSAKYEGVQIRNAGRTSMWNVVKVGEKFMYYTEHQKLDIMEEIKAMGFENNQYFANKRGYIWSRTFPLLTENIIVGSGPDTFVYEFPNNDYVGKNNLAFYGATVTKPHNMFLQIWVQTGLVSLIAFLALFFLYFVKSLKMYWNRSLETLQEKIGFSLMIAVLGYMVTGISNDSCVAVAPLYWGLLGLGFAINKMVAGESMKTTKKRT